MTPVFLRSQWIWVGVWKESEDVVTMIWIMIKDSSRLEMSRQRSETVGSVQK
jgi:hypothetical protein